MNKNLFNELGKNLLSVVKLLSEDKELKQLLKYPVTNPYELKEPTFQEVYLKNITVLPKVDFEQLKEGIVVVNIPRGDRLYDNDEFFDNYFSIDIFTTMDSWIINDLILRPFKIMQIIQNKIDRKRLTGIGTIELKNFSLEVVSEEVTCYHMVFGVNTDE